MIVLGEHDFPSRASNFGNLAEFMATFSHMCTAHAEKRLYMSLYRENFDTGVRFFDADFLTENDISAI